VVVHDLTIVADICMCEILDPRISMIIGDTKYWHIANENRLFILEYMCTETHKQ